HEMGAGHPESPERLDAIERQLTGSGLSKRLVIEEARAATDVDLLRVHSASHLSYLAQIAPASGYSEIDADTILNPHTLTAARYAAGAGLEAIGDSMQYGARCVFCILRPPGDVAKREPAMRFCFHNKVAEAIAYAMEHYRVQRLNRVDFDIHH